MQTDQAADPLRQQLGKLLDEWNAQVTELYMLKSLNDPLLFDPASTPNPIELEVFLKSRNIFHRHRIDPDTLEPLDHRFGRIEPFVVARSPTSFGTLMMLSPLVLHSNDSKSQLYHQLPVGIEGEKEPARTSKFKPMDLYQFYLECKQLPTSQLLQSSQRIVQSRNWLSSRNELKACKIIQRLEQLKENGFCSQRVPINTMAQEPKPKAHCDWMLEEMRWLSLDLWEEREWRKRTAKVLADEAVRFLTQKQNLNVQNDSGELQKEHTTSIPNGTPVIHLNPPVTVTKFLNSTMAGSGYTVQGGILGPPNPCNLNRPLKSLETALVPLVSTDSVNQCGDGYISCTPPTSDYQPPKIEDRMLTSLAEMYCKNWNLVYEHLILIAPQSVELRSPIDCLNRYQSLTGDKATSSKSTIQSGTFNLTREYEALVNCEIDRFVKVADTIGARFHDRPNRWGGSVPGLPKKSTNTPLNPNVAFQAHPSHEATLKKHLATDDFSTVTELLAKRNKLASNSVPGNNSQPMPAVSNGTPVPVEQPVQMMATRPASATSPVAFNAPMNGPPIVVMEPSPSLKQTQPMVPIPIQVPMQGTPQFSVKIPSNPIFTAPPQGATPVVNMQAIPFTPGMMPTSSNAAMTRGKPIIPTKRTPARESGSVQQPTAGTRRGSKKTSTELVLDE